jgi:hypothetical protein
MERLKKNAKYLIQRVLLQYVIFIVDCKSAPIQWNASLQ